MSSSGEETKLPGDLPSVNLTLRAIMSGKGLGSISTKSSSVYLVVI